MSPQLSNKELIFVKERSIKNDIILKATNYYSPLGVSLQVFKSKMDE